MALLPTELPPPTHWLTDAVEHLRAVHFALVTVSVVLLIVISGTKDLPVEKARTEATEIVDLPQKWDRVTQEAAEEAIRNARVLDQHAVAISIPAPISPQIRDGLLGYMNVRPREFAKLIANYSQLHMDKVPDSIADFQIWWDFLHSGISIGIPALTSSARECRAWVSEPLHVHRLEKFTKPNCVILKDASGTDVVPNGTGLISAEWSDYYEGTDVFLIGKIAFDEQGRLIDSNGCCRSGSTKIQIAIPYTVVNSSFDEKFLRNIYGDWRTGTFVQAFPELVEVSEDFKYLDFAHVPDRIKELPLADQTVDVLGLRIPSAGANFWGPFFLIAVQLYFWLHLDELTRKIASTAPGWKLLGLVSIVLFSQG